LHGEGSEDKDGSTLPGVEVIANKPDGVPRMDCLEIFDVVGVGDGLFFQTEGDDEEDDDDDYTEPETVVPVHVVVEEAGKAES